MYIHTYTYTYIVLQTTPAPGPQTVFIRESLSRLVWAGAATSNTDLQATGSWPRLV